MKYSLIIFCLLVFSCIWAENLIIATTSQDYNISLEDISHITFEGDVSNEEIINIVSKIPINNLFNYPNPFNNSSNLRSSGTTINFNLEKEGKTKIEIFNLKGQKIITVLDEKLSAGNHKINWDGKNRNGKKTPSGMYFYKVSSNKKSLVKKMLILK